MKKAIFIDAVPDALTVTYEFPEQANRRPLAPYRFLSSEDHRFLSRQDKNKIIFSELDLERIEQAIAYTLKHHTNHISPEALSLEVNLSVPKLQAGLRMRTGYSLHKYLEQVRIRSSMNLLEETNMPLKAIASRVGFKTHSHFGEVFKKLANMPPSEYRRQYRN
jgi:AraC-like DNA-binding protein